MRIVDVRERKPYSKSELKVLLKISEGKLTNIIRALKLFNILKITKNRSEEAELSDLSNLDNVIVAESEVSDNCAYVFSYVGIIMIEGFLIRCYPKYLFSYDYLNDDREKVNTLKQVLKVLQKYNTNNQSISLFDSSESHSPFGRLAMIIALLDDYFQNGIYSNNMKVMEFNGTGEINWDRTINQTQPIWHKENPYYINLYTRKNIINNNDFMQRLHACLLNVCSKELSSFSLDDLLDIGVVGLPDSEYKLEDLGDTDYILNQIDNEIGIQFNTRKQNLLLLMAALVRHLSRSNNNDTIDFFGTTSFHTVWEKVCAEVFDNQLMTSLSLLPLRQPVQLPDNVQDVNAKNLKEIIEKPVWQGEDGSTRFEVLAKDTLIPDLISIDYKSDRYIFCILDAKYYTIHLNRKDVKYQPGIGDINKQYLYQLAYKSFIEKNNIKSVKNCFLMPTESNKINKVGTVHMNMLDILGLEPIQVREIPASLVFDYYLKGSKIPLSELSL